MEAPDGEWAVVATLGRTHGLRGELFADGWQELERFRALREVRLREPGGKWIGEGRAFRVEGVRPSGGRLLIRFEGIDSLEEAKPLTGSEMVIPIGERPPLEEGEFYLSDLLDCCVVDRRSGREVGRVVSWYEFGGPPTLEVVPAGASGSESLLIPCVREICTRIDPGAKRIEIDPPDGLLELNRSGAGE